MIINVDRNWKLLPAQDLSHTVGTACTFCQLFQFEKFDKNTVSLHVVLEIIGQIFDGNDVAWRDADIIAGKVVLVFVADGDDADSSLLKELHKAPIGGGLVVIPPAVFAGVDVNGQIMGFSFLRMESGGRQGDQIMVDDVEVSVQMHLCGVA